MNIILFNKYTQEKIDSDELYREVITYKVDGKQADMMAVIKGDGFARAYNMDFDTYYKPNDENDYSDTIPKDVLEKLEELACEQIVSDYTATTQCCRHDE